jgi:hypothetical protein
MTGICPNIEKHDSTVRYYPMKEILLYRLIISMRIEQLLYTEENYSQFNSCAVSSFGQRSPIGF